MPTLGAKLVTTTEAAANSASNKSTTPENQAICAFAAAPRCFAYGSVAGDQDRTPTETLAAFEDLAGALDEMEARRTFGRTVVTR